MSVASNSSISLPWECVSFRHNRSLRPVNSGLCTEKFQEMSALSSDLFTICSKMSYRASMS